ncbi:MAG: ribosome biogenesis GTPase Der [Acholeplasmatales bacterium]|jgi:ribosome-associated GTPase engA|nr:ribosome biogenesis GTPase Der [Acholeplasmatales bacterium]MDY4016772.1 ribosome biogenesis GTPase Der [Bacilli bacterium]CDD21706.1 gTPase Der [Firmicutes bacterium CAG:313]
MKRGTVAIIGRPNVGKSSLFNRLSGDKLAITDDASGITRDRLYTKCEWLNQEFSIIDTGGIELKNVPFMEEIKAQAQLAIDEADVIILVTDGRVGVTNGDKDVIKILHKSKKPVIVAANKIDDVKFMDNIYEFYNLGVDDVIAVSALHGIGVGDLLDKVVELLPEKKEKRYDDAVEFCIIGQPNVGKSSLTNAILGTERVIVSDIAGTTRDAIDSKFTRDGKNYVVIDTAGIRKQGKIYENAEKYSVLRAIKAIERSEVVLFVLDGTKEIEEQDKRIAGYAAEYNKAVIIVVNKWDAVDKDEKSMKEFTEKIRKNFLFISYAPIVFVSALKNQRIQTLFEQIKIVYENYNRRIATNVLNDIILDASIMNQAPIFNGDRIRVYYGSQVDTKPPTFVLFVNDPNYMHFSYQRYLENRFRSAFMLEGTPIKLVLRKREN